MRRANAASRQSTAEVISSSLTSVSHMRAGSGALPWWAGVCSRARVAHARAQHCAQLMGGRQRAPSWALDSGVNKAGVCAVCRARAGTSRCNAARPLPPARHDARRRGACRCQLLASHIKAAASRFVLPGRPQRLHTRTTYYVLILIITLLLVCPARRTTGSSSRCCCCRWRLPLRSCTYLRPSPNAPTGSTSVRYTRMPYGICLCGGCRCSTSPHT